MEDGGWRMEDGGWRMEDGGWRMENRGETQKTEIGCRDKALPCLGSSRTA
jgi:hypothetical protein